MSYEILIHTSLLCILNNAMANAMSIDVSASAYAPAIDIRSINNDSKLNNTLIFPPTCTHHTYCTYYELINLKKIPTFYKFKINDSDIFNLNNLELSSGLLCPNEIKRIGIQFKPDEIKKYNSKYFLLFLN